MTFLMDLILKMLMTSSHLLHQEPPHLTGRQVTVDDAAYPTTNMDRFVEPYPSDAGQGIRKSKTRFEK